MFQWRRFVIILFISLALFFLDKAHFFNSTFSLINRLVIQPAVHLVIGATEETSFLFKNIFAVRSLIQENLFLKSQRDFFREEYFKMSQTSEENKFLRQALHLKKEQNQKLVLANILSFDPFQASDSFLIDKGSSAGIKLNDPVILAGGVVVGQVSEVNNKESRVLLISSSRSRFTAFLEASKTNGTIVGSAGGVLLLDLILKETPLRPGEIVLTSGLDGIFPQGLLVGEISKVFDNGAASFKKAAVRPFFNRRDLKQVFVLISD